MSNFLNSAISLFSQVAILFVMIAIGFISSKTKLINEKSNEGLINLLLYVITPCLIINSFLKVEFTSKSAISLATAIGCAFISHFIAIAISFIIKDKDFKKRSVLRFGTIFSNAGYMGIPLAQAVFGEKGVFFGSAYVIVFNFIQWTYGITIYNKDKNNLLKVVLNPATIAVIVGLPLFFLKIKLPEIIETPLNYMAELNTPIAMLVTGYFFSRSDFKKGLFSGKMWSVISLRMIVIPIIILILFKYIFKLDGILLSCCILPVSAPTAVNTMILASKYEADTDLGLKLISITTVLSIITMPLILALAGI